VISWGPMCDETPVRAASPSVGRGESIPVRDWLGDLPETPSACARKAILLAGAGIVLGALGAWLPRDIGTGASDVPTARVLFVALLTTATSLVLHGMSYAIGVVKLSRRLRAGRADALSSPAVVIRSWPIPDPSTTDEREAAIDQRI
jgi:hypothetical protein